MRSDLTERVIYLRSIPVASELPTKVVHVLASCFRERVFSAGDVLMREGEPLLALHLITLGTLELTRAGKPFGTLKAPQSLGFLGILARAEGTYDAVAATDVRTLEIDAETMLEVMEDQPPFLQATLRYAAQRMYYEMQDLPAAALSLPPETLPFKVGERPLDFVERIVFLRALRAFSKTNLASLAIMSRQITEVRLEADTPLWSTGDAPTSSLMVVAGEIECRTKDGRVFKYGPGTVAGGVDGLASKPRWYDAKTVGKLVAFEGRAHELIALLEDDFAMALDFIGTMSTGLIAMLERKAALGQSPLAVQRNVSRLGAVPVGA